MYYMSRHSRLEWLMKCCRVCRTWRHLWTLCTATLTHMMQPYGEVCAAQRGAMLTGTEHALGQIFASFDFQVLPFDMQGVTARTRPGSSTPSSWRTMCKVRDKAMCRADSARSAGTPNGLQAHHNTDEMLRAISTQGQEGGFDHVAFVCAGHYISRKLHPEFDPHNRTNSFLSVAFYDQMVVLEKGPHPQPAPVLRGSFSIPYGAGPVDQAILAKYKQELAASLAQ